MAEDVARSRQYAHTANSNLVLEADRDSRRRHDEPTGEVESLAGKISYRMGDRAQKAAPPVHADSNKHKRSRDEEQEARLKKKIKQLARGASGMGETEAETKGLLFTTGGLAAAKTNILQESMAVEANSYQPTNAQSQEAFEEMLSML